MYYLLNKYASQELKLFLVVPPVISTKGTFASMETFHDKTSRTLPETPYTLV